MSRPPAGKPPSRCTPMAAQLAHDHRGGRLAVDATSSSRLVAEQLEVGAQLCGVRLRRLARTPPAAHAPGSLVKSSYSDGHCPAGNTSIERRASASIAKLVRGRGQEYRGRLSAWGACSSSSPPPANSASPPTTPATPTASTATPITSRRPNSADRGGRGCAPCAPFASSALTGTLASRDPVGPLRVDGVGRAPLVRPPAAAAGFPMRWRSRACRPARLRRLPCSPW